jgi:4-diphosphocytidyl-2-C-methyl-D-erythritol kinase
VARAADLLWRHLRRDGPVRDVAVRLEKRIPMQAGLGGGSADAAAALLGLARLWDVEIAPAELATLGHQLGADVGFFFTGGAALGLGRGDEIHPLADLPRLGVLVVVPAFAVSTADAYRWLDEDIGRVGQVGKMARSGPAIPGCTWPAPDGDVVNDFEPVVAARHPEIAQIVGALRAAGVAAAAMTGSGSAVFGLFDNDAVLEQAAQALEAASRSIERTRTLSRAEYLQASAPVATRVAPTGRAL